MMLFHMPKVVAQDKPGCWHVWSNYEDSWYLLRIGSKVWPCGRDDLSDELLLGILDSKTPPGFPEQGYFTHTPVVHS